MSAPTEKPRRVRLRSPRPRRQRTVALAAPRPEAAPTVSRALAAPRPEAAPTVSRALAAPRPEAAPTVSRAPAPGPTVVPTPTAAPAPSLEKRLGPFTLREELGRGGMGVVYRAFHEALDREVALKLLLVPVDVASPEQTRRFRAEARAAGRLRHRNLVTIHDAGTTPEGLPYMAMELIEGQSLEQRVLLDGPLPVREAARLTATLAQAVAYAHARKVLHRDLKPANVLLDAAGEPFLTDFGLAKDLARLTAGPATATGQILGTPGYMPPEQAQGAPADARADVYGLGATLYEALTGRPPFEGPSLVATLQAVLHERLAPPSELRPEVDRALDAIVLRCLARDPADRYGSVRALATDLIRYLGSGSGSGSRPSPLFRPDGPWRHAREHWHLGAVAGVLVAGALALAGFGDDGRAAAAVEPPGRHAERVAPERPAAPTPAAVASTPAAPTPPTPSPSPSSRSHSPSPAPATSPRPERPEAAGPERVAAIGAARREVDRALAGSDWETAAAAAHRALDAAGPPGDRPDDLVEAAGEAGYIVAVEVVKARAVAAYPLAQDLLGRVRGDGGPLAPDADAYADWIEADLLARESRDAFRRGDFAWSHRALEAVLEFEVLGPDARGGILRKRQARSRLVREFRRAVEPVLAARDEVAAVRAADAALLRRLRALTVDGGRLDGLVARWADAVEYDLWSEGDGRALVADLRRAYVDLAGSGW